MDPTPREVSFEVDGRPVRVADDGAALLEVLRDRLGVRSPKDGCSPQGQCGCCTVLVDGEPRVSCVTPLRRLAGRSVTTLDGLDPERRQRWVDAFFETGASQCGFCTPGIVLRLDALTRRPQRDPEAAVERALLAHVCRCTGWRSVLEAYRRFDAATTAEPSQRRDLDAATARARLEGGAAQQVGPGVAAGQGGFADDGPPDGALVAVPDGSGGFALGETLSEARAAAGRVLGRQTTASPTPPLQLPAGDWAVTLRTSWVEPAYLETDASWCAPGGEPASPLANGGAFGGKVDSDAAGAARRLADETGRSVRVLYSRQDTVALGPKRPPIAAGVDADGRGIIRVVRTPGIEPLLAHAALDLVVEQVVAPGPPTSTRLRAVGWAEATVLAAGLAGVAEPVTSPAGATARAEIDDDGAVHAWVSCGSVLDEVVLRSYCIGAAHMALGWVTSEGLTVAEDGTVEDLTIRSFGVLRAVETPRIVIEIEPSDTEPVNGSDAVFAAVAAATWLHQGRPTDWPTGQRVRS